MCLTCGCGEPNKEMGEANITYDDIRRAADANDLTVAETVEKLRAAVDLEAQDLAKA